MAPSGKWAIAIHGGAGAISRSIDRLPYETALAQALDQGVAVLENDKLSDVWALHNIPHPPLALAAALAAVETMENNYLFNAGKGSVLNDQEFVENEASVMYGQTLRTGAVCGLRTVQNPARLATIVHSAARFQFLGFEFAEAYADNFPGTIQRRPREWFITERRYKALLRAKAKGRAELDHSGGGTVTKAPSNVLPEQSSTPTAESKAVPEGETVGAAVCDGAGNVACVTSTGGQTYKMAGRIGDTPVIGAGSYASNRSCALSGTGNGEHFLRLSAASRVCFAMEYGGMSCRDAVNSVVHREFPSGAGGFVCVTPSGEVVTDFNSKGMFRGARNWQGLDTVRIWED